MEIISYVLSAIVAYLLGSVSLSVIVSKTIYRSDVRKHGSGNAGATNVARVFGVLGGVIVLLGDFLKAVVSLCLAKFVFTLISPDVSPDLCVMLAGIFCVIGHAYPVFFKFKGGKGVTVGAAIALFADYRAVLAGLAVFVAVFAISRIVSLSSVSAAITIVAAGIILFVLVETFSVYMLVLCAFTGLFVIFLHRSNIKRLIKGEEKKFSFAKKKKEKTENSDEKSEENGENI
ncbi:MAG TPA: acyl-phosphate glycerol 3-phosphate acyltransferase [Clostridiales bacterium]|nr:acyl-phosphate glycerol 3-phosphate acyltransferase [Clostridiales bacterium]